MVNENREKKKEENNKDKDNHSSYGSKPPPPPQPPKKDILYTKHYKLYELTSQSTIEILSIDIENLKQHPIPILHLFETDSSKVQ